MFSCEVFQHLDSDDPVRAYLVESFRVLAKEGTVCFQVPVRGLHPWSFLSSRTRYLLLLGLRKLGRRRMMMYRRFRADAVLKILESIGFVDVELRLFHADEQPGFHAYFLARKAPVSSR